MMPAALNSLAPSIAHLRVIATPVADYRVLPFGVEALDGRLGAGGLRAGALHEATARSGALVDDAATTLFLAGLAAREAASTGGPVLWASFLFLGLKRVDRPDRQLCSLRSIAVARD